MDNQQNNNQESSLSDNGITENSENIQKGNKTKIKQILIAVFIVFAVLICSILVWMTITKPDPYMTVNDSNINNQDNSTDHITVTGEARVTKDGYYIGEYVLPHEEIKKYKDNNDIGGEVVLDGQVERDVISMTVKNEITNWQTYQNGELGFELKYPTIWSKEGEIDFPLSLKIVYYSDLPEALGPNDYAMTPTKEDLNNLKKEINNVESENILEIDNKKLQVVTEFSVSGGAFYRQARFFIDNDLVEVTVALPSSQIYSWPKDRDKIEIRRKQFESGQIDEQTKITLYQFDKLVESIKIYE